MPHIGQTSTKGPEEKMDIPEMTEAEKLASIDSCIESAIMILRNEIKRRAQISSEPYDHYYLSECDVALRNIEYYHQKLNQ
jgi:hypothetical protein